MQDQSKTWVHLPRSHPNRPDVAVNEPEWSVLMEIIEDRFSVVDPRMIQQRVQAGAHKQNGETVKYSEKRVGTK